MHVLLRSLFFLKRTHSLMFFIPISHVCYIYDDDDHHHHLFLKRLFLPRSARVRRLPRYEASPVSTYPRTLPIQGANLTHPYNLLHILSKSACPCSYYSPLPPPHFFRLTPLPLDATTSFMNLYETLNTVHTRLSCSQLLCYRHHMDTFWNPHSEELYWSDTAWPLSYHHSLERTATKFNFLRNRLIYSNLFWKMKLYYRNHLHHLQIELYINRFVSV